MLVLASRCRDEGHDRSGNRRRDLDVVVGDGALDDHGKEFLRDHRDVLGDDAGEFAFLGRSSDQHRQRSLQ